MTTTTSSTTQRTRRIAIGSDALVVDLYEPTLPTGELPVLLLHGWGGSGRYWAQTIARLRERFPLIVPDLPGVGRSMPVRQARDMFGQMAALETMCTELGLRRIHVVGHSMGGGITVLLAAKRPDLVERLVLTSIALFESNAQRQFFNRVVDSAAQMMRLRGVWMADVPGLVQQAARPFFTSVPNQPELLRAAFRDYLTMDRATAIASARTATSLEIPRAAAQIAAPTLLIVGRDDRYMPHENVEGTVRLIPLAESRWMERCGHLPMVERPDEYTSLLNEFLGNSGAHHQHGDGRALNDANSG